MTMFPPPNPCPTCGHDTYAFPTAPPAPEWQPIATAPKDGTWFLGWCEYVPVQDRIQVFRWHEAPLAEDSGWMNAPDTHEHGFDHAPTYWQPLLAPPAQLQASPQPETQS